MLSLFCVVVCVLAQLNNSAAHPAAIMLRKRRVVGFIDMMCIRIDGTFAMLHSHPLQASSCSRQNPNFGVGRLLDFTRRGGRMFSRNWVWHDSKALGDEHLLPSSGVPGFLIRFSVFCHPPSF